MTLIHKRGGPEKEAFKKHFFFGVSKKASSLLAFFLHDLQIGLVPFMFCMLPKILKQNKK